MKNHAFCLFCKYFISVFLFRSSTVDCTPKDSISAPPVEGLYDARSSDFTNSPFNREQVTMATVLQKKRWKMNCVVQPSFPPPPSPPPQAGTYPNFLNMKWLQVSLLPSQNVVKTKMHIQFCSQVCHRYSYHILYPSLIYYFTVHTHGSMQSICVILLSY